MADQIDDANDLHTVLKAEATQPATLPSVDNILAAMVDPPAVPPLDKDFYRKRFREAPQVRRVVDYPAMEAANRSLGAAGEEFAVRFDVARLLAARKDRLAAKVDRVSVSRGDGLGYDVLSFEVGGRERFIEVKTTAYGPATPFIVTRKEVAVSKESAAHYHLYRLFDFRREPRLFQKPGQIEQAFTLDPTARSRQLVLGYFAHVLLRDELGAAKHVRRRRVRVVHDLERTSSFRLAEINPHGIRVVRREARDLHCHRLAALVEDRDDHERRVARRAAFDRRVHCAVTVEIADDGKQCLNAAAGLGRRLTDVRAK